MPAPAAWYRIVDVPATGAFATVAIAEPVGAPGTRVALKVLKEELAHDAGAWDRFRDEARILAALDHPNIVKAHRLLDYGDRLVMELDAVDGANLERVVGSLRSVPWRAALRIAERVADALHFAYHAPGGPGGQPMRIVHRDLKPANVMLTPGGEVRILDFGVAKGEFQDRSAMSLHNVWGTVGYDAPERRDGVAQPASDVYALGVLTFVLLTGRPVAVSRKVEHHDREVAAVLEHLAPVGLVDRAPLVALLSAMVQHDLRARPTMAEVRDRLQGLLTTGLTGESPDLERFARIAHAELGKWSRAPKLTANPWFGEVRFLEERAPEAAPPPLDALQAHQEVRRLLVAADWEQRVGQVKRVLERVEGTVERPFLDILDRASPPWWRFWEKPSRPTEVVAALVLLCDQPSPAAASRARRLGHHPDERIRNAARFLLDRHAGAAGLSRATAPRSAAAGGSEPPSGLKGTR